MSADAGTWLENIDARMHVADSDNLVYVHVVVAADFRELVRKGDIDGAEGIFHDLRHFGGSNVCYDSPWQKEEYNALIFSPIVLSSAPIVRLLCNNS